MGCGIRLNGIFRWRKLTLSQNKLSFSFLSLAHQHWFTMTFRIIAYACFNKGMFLGSISFHDTLLTVRDNSVAFPLCRTNREREREKITMAAFEIVWVIWPSRFTLVTYWWHSACGCHPPTKKWMSDACRQAIRPSCFKRLQMSGHTRREE